MIYVEGFEFSKQHLYLGAIKIGQVIKENFPLYYSLNYLKL